MPTIGRYFVKLCHVRCRFMTPITFAEIHIAVSGPTREVPALGEG